jgi:hypothetical protein
VPDAELTAAMSWVDGEYESDFMARHGMEKLTEIGEEFSAMHLRLFRSTRGETCLIDVVMSDRAVYVWCDHVGDLLACLRWIVPTAEGLLRLEQAVEAFKRIVDLTYVEGAMKTAGEAEGDARLIAAGYTSDDIDRMERLKRAEQTRLAASHKAARDGQQA